MASYQAYQLKTIVYKCMRNVRAMNLEILENTLEKTISVV
jgi:hypothetical protein